MVRKLVLSLIAILALCVSIFAQNKQVSGTVTDAAGAPVAGATVMVEGTHNGTTTGTDGKFVVAAPANGALQISFIGYMSQKVNVAGKSVVNVSLVEDTQTIDDVVVTGYGVTRKAAFTGAASTVSEAMINSKVDANFMKSLQGAVTGLTMNNSSGGPGAYAKVFVRGVGSINSGTQPLYVVDGMPIFSDETSMSDLSTSNSNMAASPMANINANDIESVTVLKDATATAIYGARAANGVIVITTKQGSEGSLNITFDTKQGVTQMASYSDKIKLLNSFELADAWTTSVMNASTMNRQQAYDWMLAKSKWDGETNSDWIGAIKRNGYVQDYNLTISGSSGKTNYFASLGYLNNEGIMIGTDMARYSGRLNVSSSYKMFSFGMNTSYTYTDYNTFSQGLGGSMSNPFVTAYASARPIDRIYNVDGSYNMAVGGGYNPVAMYDGQYGDIYHQKITVANFNPYLAVNFGKGFVAKTSVGVNLYGLKEYNFWSQMQEQGASYNGLGQQYDNQYTTITWTNTLSWNRTFNEKHNVSAMIGQEMQDKRRFYEYYAASNFSFLGYRDMATASEAQGPGANETQRAKLASYFFNAEYDYDNRYYVSGSYRRDGSSVFGSDRYWGNFWSVGGKWRLSQENFLKDNAVLTNATIRASYGVVGNQDIGWYAARGFYETGANYANAPGIIPSSINNPFLGWESSKKFNFGVDLGISRRVELTIDAYKEKTTEMIFDMPLSMTTGNASTKRNIGSMQNVGIEVGINATLIARKDFSWTLYVNASHNKNKINELSTKEPIIGSITIREAGRPLNQFYMPQWAGVNPENGLPLWYKGSEGDEVTSDYNEAGKRYVGSADPKMFGGFGTNFQWKGLDFSANFTYTLGNKVYVDNNAFDLQTGSRGFANMTQYVYQNAWTPDNRYTDVPRLFYGDTSQANEDSSRFLYDGSYMRLKNLTIGYTFPQKWLKKVYMQKLRVYFTADNVWTVKSKDFVGIDPETYSDGIQMWQYPLARTFSFGVTVGF